MFTCAILPIIEATEFFKDLFLAVKRENWGRKKARCCESVFIHGDVNEELWIIVLEDVGQQFLRYIFPSRISIDDIKFSRQLGIRI
jgi:hypothetical protein